MYFISEYCIIFTNPILSASMKKVFWEFPKKLKIINQLKNNELTTKK